MVTEAERAAEAGRKIKEHVSAGKVVLSHGTYSSRWREDLGTKACVGALALACGADVPRGADWRTVRKLIPATVAKGREIDQLEMGYEGSTYGWMGETEPDYESPFHQLGRELRELSFVQAAKEQTR